MLPPTVQGMRVPIALRAPPAVLMGTVELELVRVGKPVVALATAWETVMMLDNF